MDSKRIIRLDGLRFAAAMAVVLFHYAFRGAAAGGMPALDLPQWFIDASSFGYLGVNLFFMISGFVIAYSAEGRSAIDFGIARFARLYPSYVAAMTLTFAVTFWFGAPLYSTGLAQYLANLTMFAPFFGQPLMDGAYWSIILEVVFYCWVFVFLAAGIFDRDCERIILVWLAIALFNEYSFGIKALRFLFLTEYAGFFAAGILIYRWRAGRMTLATLPLLTLSLAVSLTTTLSGLKVIEANYHTDYSDGIVLAMAAGLYVLFFAATSGKPLRGSARLLSMLGALTYPLYLIHQQIGYIAISRLKGFAGDWLLLAGVTGAILLAALAIRLLIDRPLVPKLRRALTPPAARAIKNVPQLQRFLARGNSAGR